MYTTTTTSQLRPGGPFGGSNPIIVVATLLVFALSVIYQLYGGSGGVSSFGPGFDHLVGQFSRLEYPITIVIAVTFGLMLLYAAVTGAWAPNAYWYALIASALCIAITFTHSLVNNRTSLPVHGFFRTILLVLLSLLLVAKFLVLYKLWLALYQPIEIGFTGMIMRNIVSFAFGWTLFSAVYGYVSLFHHFSPGTYKLFFWGLELATMILTIATVSQNMGGMGLQSLIGCVICYAWILIGRLLPAQGSY